MRQQFKMGFTPLNSDIPTAKRRYLTGFTLIELLVVCAIIGVLATIVIVNLTGAKENSKVSAAVSQLNSIRKAAEMYRVDTHQWPATCLSGGLTASYCTKTSTSAATPPYNVDTFFWNPNNIAGWNGPYFEGGISTMTHPWGGAVDYYNGGLSSCGATDQGILLNDDRSGHSSSDNSGAIPLTAIQKIDDKLDNGDLSAGSIIESTNPNPSGNPADPRIHIGELMYCFPSS